MNRHTFICVPCRYVAKAKARVGGKCPRCGAVLRHMGRRWRPPKKHDDRAWRNIAMGQYLWDEKALGGVLLTSSVVPVRVQRRNRSLRPRVRGRWQSQ